MSTETEVSELPENISNLHEKNFRIHVEEHSARLLKEKGGEDKSSERDLGRLQS